MGWARWLPHPQEAGERPSPGLCSIFGPGEGTGTELGVRRRRWRIPHKDHGPRSNVEAQETVGRALIVERAWIGGRSPT